MNNRYTPLATIDINDHKIHLKLEYMNPVGSIKYRAIPAFIRTCVETKEIKKGDNILLVSAGSAGVATAWVANQVGCKATILLPADAPQRIFQILDWLGAKVYDFKNKEEMDEVLCSLSAAKNTYLFAQIKEPRLIEYYKNIAFEIVAQLPQVDAILVGIGTGISLMGIAKGFKELNKNISIYGVEPAEAPVASQDTWGAHNIPGLAPPIPQPLLDKNLIKDIILIPSQKAWDTAQLVAQQNSLMIGPSSGATVAGALELLKLNGHKHIVAICASSILEYL